MSKTPRCILQSDNNTRCSAGPAKLHEFSYETATDATYSKIIFMNDVPLLHVYGVRRNREHFNGVWHTRSKCLLNIKQIAREEFHDLARQIKIISVLISTNSRAKSGPSVRWMCCCIRNDARFRVRGPTTVRAHPCKGKA